MALDPRAEWDFNDAPIYMGAIEAHGWASGVASRLAALRPQLDAADALAKAWLVRYEVASDPIFESAATPADVERFAAAYAKATADLHETAERFLALWNQGDPS